MPDLQPVSWERMIRAVEKVRERLLKATAALEAAGVPYAVTGGNAVAAWVSRVDEAAVRNTRDVDLLVRRADFKAVQSALEAAGFVYRHAAGIEMFLDGPRRSARDAVSVRFAGDEVGSDDAPPASDVTAAELVKGVRVLSLEVLVWMEPRAFRTLNHVHLRDLIEVGLVDESWAGRLPSPLSERLRTLLDDPDG